MISPDCHLPHSSIHVYIHANAIPGDFCEFPEKTRICPFKAIFAKHHGTGQQSPSPVFDLTCRITSDLTCRITSRIGLPVPMVRWRCCFHNVVFRTLFSELQFCNKFQSVTFVFGISDSIIIAFKIDLNIIIPII